VIQRGAHGWEGSAINEYVMYGDEQTFKEIFRVTRNTFRVIQKQLCDAGYLRANQNQNAAYQQTSDFKLAVCLYFFAGRGKGDMQAVGDAGHIGRSTVLKYVDEFVNGVLHVLKRTYMPSKAPPNERLREIRLQFASRRGIANVAMAVDGTHVPYVPPIEKFRNEYKNYKGWMSILVVAFVNSFHFFVDVDVGYPGKAGDSSVLRDSRFLAKVSCDKAAWLGDDGVIAADSGASDRGQLLLNPIPNPKSEKDVWYNFATRRLASSLRRHLDAGRTGFGSCCGLVTLSP